MSSAALSPQSRARFAWMFWSDIEEDGERHFDVSCELDRSLLLFSKS